MAGLESGALVDRVKVGLGVGVLSLATQEALFSCSLGAVVGIGQH